MRALIAIALLFLAACAQIRPLQGGVKDTRPPMVVLWEPDSVSRNFSGNSFSITFNEYVNTSTLAQELVVSPPLKSLPLIKVKKRTLTVAWKDTLAENTTYVFNMGSGVVDVNEGNVAAGLMHVLSTGATIDSLQLAAEVRQFNTLEPAKKCRVLLYQNDTSITARKAVPGSLAFTNDKGQALLPYLSNKPWHMYALDDQNGNYTWDETEAVAFLDSTVMPQYLDSVIRDLRLSVPRPAKPMITDYKTDSLGHVHFAWDPFFNGLHFRPLSDSVQVQWKMNTERDSAEVTFVPARLDEEFKCAVLLDSTCLDTIALTVYKDAGASAWKATLPRGNRALEGKPWLLEMSRAFTLADASLVTLKRDSIALSVAATARPDDAQWLEVASFKAPKGKYTLTLFPGALRDAYGNTHDTISVALEQLAQDDVGMIRLNVQTPVNAQALRLQLLTAKGAVMEERALGASGEYTFDGLLPMEYTFRVYEDANANGLIDPCDVVSRKQPERCWMYPGKMNVRANWEMTQQWEIK